MDMSVPINQTGGQAREADAKSPPRSANSSDLDAWLDRAGSGTDSGVQPGAARNGGSAKSVPPPAAPSGANC